jgi:hypothetical protein
MIEKLKPFGKLFIKVEPAIKGIKKSGKRAVEKKFPDHPYTAEELQEWVAKGGNYGILCGNGLVLIDLDTVEAQEIFEKNVVTFTVTSGRESGGKHYYVESDAKENGVLLVNGKNVGNIQVKNKYLVGAGSTHWSGNQYTISNDAPIATVNVDKLEKIFGEMLQLSRQGKSEKDASKEVKKLLANGIEASIADFVDLDELREIGVGEYQGEHPIHGSETGNNFTVNTEKNCWHCFRCNSGGGILSWIAVENGIIKCEEAQAGALKGQKFKDVMKLLKKYAEQAEYEKARENLEPLSYHEWLDILEENFPHIKPMAEAAACVLAQLKLTNVSLPFVLVFCDVPSTLKTTIIRMFEDMPEYTFKTSHFTAASFVSHSAKSKKRELEDIDLIPKIKHKMLLCLDMSTFFAEPDDQLKSELGVFTEVCDGRGYESDSGSHGHRGYKGDYNFMMLSATTPIPYSVWKIMGTLGHRIHFFNCDVPDPTEDDMIDMFKDADVESKMRTCKEATARFVRSWLKPEEKVTWNRKGDSDELLALISKYSKFLCHLRGIMNAYVTEEPNPFTGAVQREVRFTRPVIEKAYRVGWRLYAQVQAHALLNERNQITLEDVNEALLPIVFSSAPEDRIIIYRYLLEKGGKATKSDLVKELKMSRTNAFRNMAVLEHLNLVTVEREAAPTQGGVQELSTMTVAEKWRWLLDTELPFRPLALGKLSQKGAANLRKYWT